MPSKPEDPELHVMSFGEHLEELRRRLIYGLLGLALVFGVMLWYSRTVVAWLFEPLITVLHLLNLPAQTYTRSSLGGIMVYMKVAFVGALVVSAPWLMFQAWKFISAGLYAAERKAATFLVGLSAIMTACGLALTYWVFLPASIVFLLQFTLTYPTPKTDPDSTLSRVSRWFIHLNHESLLPSAPDGHQTPAPTTDPANHTLVPEYKTDPHDPQEGEIWYNHDLNEIRGKHNGNIIVYVTSPESMMGPMLDPMDYLSEAIMLALGVVIVFHVPVVMCVLGMSGLVNPKTLAKRRLIVLFCCFLLAFIFVPGQDLFSNGVIPLLAYCLFEFGLILMRIFYNRHERRRAAEDAKYAGTDGDYSG